MAKSSGRLLSLDIFRGLTVAFMILVNTPGSWKFVYPPLRHSEWHGCTPADLVFPFFLFIVGVSVWYSFRKYGHELTGGAFLRVLRRSISIFALGIILAIFPYFIRDYSTLRIMGVLQRIALAYGIGAIICLSVRREYLWMVTAAFLIIYWGLLWFPGGSDPYSAEGNFALVIDKAILGQDHLYTGFGIPFDPEGLAGTIPAVCTVLIGFYTGVITGKGHADGKKALKILLLGAGSAGIGLLWGRIFPINKPLWTSSYVLFTAGMAMTLYSMIYYLVEVLRFASWGTPFRVFGTNALFSYFIAGIWTRLMVHINITAGESEFSLYSWIYEKIFVPIADQMIGSLMFAIVQVVLIWLLALILYRRKIMIRL